MLFVFHPRNFAIIVLLSFVAVATFCIWAVSAMSIDSTMNNCIFHRSKTILCGTNVQSHISAWQNFLNIIPQRAFNLLMPALLLVFTSLIYGNNLIRPRAPDILQRIKTKLYQAIGIIDPIARALSRGIIQPKIYNSLIG